MTIWTEDHINRLRAMLADDLPYSTIAAALGCTRSGVSGKVHRLGLANKMPAQKRPAAPRKARTEVRWSEERRLNYSLTRQRAEKITKPVPFKPRRTKAASLNVPLLDLDANQCRYTISETAPYLFCGQPTQGTSWCEACHGIVFGRPVATPDQLAKAAKMRAAKGKVWGRAA